MADYAKIYAVRLMRTDKNGKVTADKVVNRIAFVQSIQYYNDNADDMIKKFETMKLPPGTMMQMVESHTLVMHEGSPESITEALMRNGWKYMDAQITERPVSWFDYMNDEAVSQKFIVTEKGQIQRLKHFVWKEVNDYYSTEISAQRRALNEMRQRSSTIIPLEWWE